MKIKFQAFTWESTSVKFSLNDFLNNIEQGKEFIGTTKKLYVIEDKDFYYGLVLTLKDHQTFTIIKEEDGNIDLSTREVGKDEKIVEFNYFVFSSKSGYGMYQYHHASCSLLSFNGYIKRHFSSMLNEKIDLIENELKEQSKSEADIAEVINKYKGKLSFTIIENAGDFEQKIKSLSDLISMECVFTDFTSSGGFIRAITNYARRFNFKISFEKNVESKSKINNAINIIKEEKPSSAKVLGLDNNKNEIEYKILSDFRTFGEFDYDDMIKDMKFNTIDIKKSLIENNIIKGLKHALNRETV